MSASYDVSRETVTSKRDTRVKVRAIQGGYEKCVEAYRGWLIVRFIKRDCSFLKSSSIFKTRNKSIQTIIVCTNKFAKTVYNR